MASSLGVNRRRNRPAGMPDPTSEVIALPSEVLLQNFKYHCFICDQGFYREQNLQLHLRSHNMQTNLQKAPNNGNRKKVYICPEPTCIYHHPSRALSDITGIKKHFARKHGNVKNWKCNKCSKFYAVEGDLKAHGKKCKMNGQYGNQNDELRSSNLSGESGRNYEQLLTEDGLEAQLHPSVVESSFSLPFSPLLAPFTGPSSTENSGPSRTNVNEFCLQSIPEGLTFTPILNGADSDEVVMAYNEAVFDIIRMQSENRIPQPPPSPSLPYSTSFSEMLNPMANPFDGFPTELSLSLGTSSTPPHTLSNNSLWPGLNQPNTQLDNYVPTFQSIDHDQPAMRGNFGSYYVDNDFMNHGFNTTVGMTLGGMIQGATIQPETIGNGASGSQGGEFYHNFMLNSMDDEAMCLGGPSSGVYRGPFSG